MDTQNQKILKYLQTHKRGITTLDAFTKLGITRLSGRIHELRRAGYDIETVDTMAKNRDGKVVRFGTYFLRG